MKRKAKAEGKIGLESVTKLLINGPTGKWGFNITKQQGTRIVKETSAFIQLLFILIYKIWPNMDQCHPLIYKF